MSTLIVGQRRRHTLTSVLQPLVFVFGLLAGGLIVVFRDDLLPEYFRFDSNKIQMVVSGYVLGDSSFDPVGAVYRALGIIDSPLLAGLVGYAAFAALLILVYARNATQSSSWYNSFLFAVSGVLGGVYLGGYSKDAFILPIVALILVLPRRWFFEVLILAAMLVYASEFRVYWLLIAAFYLPLRLCLLRVRRLRSLLLLLVGSSVVVSLGIYFATGAAPDSYRTVVNATRSDIATNTIIMPFITGPEPFAGIVNNLLTQVVLVVPLPLVALGGVYYVFLALVILLLWVGFFFSARLVLHMNSTRERDFESIVLVRCMALIVAFLSVQAAFEPDYGSALRHLVPLLPAMLMVGMSARGLARNEGAADSGHNKLRAGV